MATQTGAGHRPHEGRTNTNLSMTRRLLRQNDTHTSTYDGGGCVIPGQNGNDGLPACLTELQGGLIDAALCATNGGAWGCKQGCTIAAFGLTDCFAHHQTGMRSFMCYISGTMCHDDDVPPFPIGTSKRGITNNIFRNFAN